MSTIKHSSASINRQKSEELKSSANKILTKITNSAKFKTIFNKRPISTINSKNIKSSLGLYNISPDSFKFVRKKIKFDGTYRKIVGIKSRRMPIPLSPKQLERELMNKDERNLMDSLLIDHRKYSEELATRMNLTMSSPSRSPHKKSSFLLRY
ncbi:hypothetical protein SteCoe_36337 [Stentor coeruleus]|uniref:Uncharacterized protein n=1 Tax=Stentor coeruleus TaxID=5963 RepID=A0A1R2AQN8_9CILI|nr:hypothetical protein SteCoe_36337 [Stentor coeruleus]